MNLKGFFLLLITISTSSCFKCGTDSLQKKIKVQSITLPKTKKRQLPSEEDSSSSHSIRIHIDSTFLEENPIPKSTISSEAQTEYKTKSLILLNSAVKLLKKLILVKTKHNTISLPSKTDEKGLICGIPKESIKPEIIDKNQGVSTDLILFPSFQEDLGDKVEASAAYCFKDNDNDRPIAGTVYLSTKYNFTKTNYDQYLIMLLMHELTHVLGFHEVIFSNLKGGSIIKTKEVNGIKRKMITSKKVVAMAKKYFNCPTLEGVELEESGGKGTAGSHWESRIMLGDYMIGIDYGEIVISEITLSLLEDLGWYEVNYYTGGLFRFGKNKGCAFLNDTCIKDQKEIFDNEFCSKGGKDKCFAGRTAKGICYLGNLNSGTIPKQFQYFDTDGKGGLEEADYCPVAIDISKDTSEYYPTHCNYGTNHTNLGEKPGAYSVCMMSTLSALNEHEEGYAGCYPISCRKQYYIVNFGEHEIKCPREGGSVKFAAYYGKLYCPDYNLVCTSSYFCNDMIDCINKKITFKDTTFDYDYEIVSSQPSEEIIESGSAFIQWAFEVIVICWVILF